MFQGVTATGGSERTQTVKDAGQLPGLSSSPVRQYLQNHWACASPCGRFWNSPSFLEAAHGGELGEGRRAPGPARSQGSSPGVLSAGACPEPPKCPPRDAKWSLRSEARLPHAHPPTGPRTAWEREARPADTHTGRELQAGT